MGKYKIPGSNLKRPKNAIYINPSHSLEHELSKFMFCWMLARGTNIDYYWKSVAKAVKAFCKIDLSEFTFPNERKHFITEATDKKHKRRDIVILDDDQAVEIVYKHNTPELFLEYTRNGVDYYEI